MICPKCGCDSFKEAYSKDNDLFYRRFYCPDCVCWINVKYDKIISDEELGLLYLKKGRIKYPYLNKFAKQYNKSIR